MPGWRGHRAHARDSPKAESQCLACYAAAIIRPAAGGRQEAALGITGCVCRTAWCLCWCRARRADSAAVVLSQRRAQHVIEVCPQLRGINGRQALPSLQQQRRLQGTPGQRAQLSDRMTVPRVTLRHHRTAGAAGLHHRCAGTPPHGRLARSAAGVKVVPALRISDRSWSAGADRLSHFAQVVVQLMIPPGQLVDLRLRDRQGIQAGMRRRGGLILESVKYMHPRR